MFNPPSEVAITSVGNSLAFAPNKISDEKVFEINSQLFFCSVASGRVARLYEGSFSHYTDADFEYVSCFHLFNNFIYRVRLRFVIGEGHYFDFHRISTNNSPGAWEFLGTVNYPITPEIHESQIVSRDKFEFFENYLFIAFTKYDLGLSESTTTVHRINLNLLTTQEIFSITQSSESWNITGFLRALAGKLYLFEFRGDYPFAAYYSVWEWSEEEATFVQSLEVFSASMPGGASCIRSFSDFGHTIPRYIKIGFSVNILLNQVGILLYDTQSNVFKHTTDIGSYFSSEEYYGRYSEIVFYNNQYYVFNYARVYRMDPETCALTLLYTFPPESGSTYFNLLYVKSLGQLVGLKTTETTSTPISFDGPLVWVTPYSPLPIPSAFVEIIYPVVPRDEDNVVAVPMGNGGYRRERKTENVVVRRESTLRFRVDRSYIGTFEADLHSRRGQLFRLPTPGYTPFGVNSSDNLVYCLPHKGAKPTDKFASTFDIDVNFLFVSVAP